MFSAPRVRLDDASVCGVLDTDWLWLFLTAPSPWLARELPDTALTLDCGRWCEFTEEAVGGGMGEGSSWLLLELEKDGWVWVLPWADPGLRKGALGVLLLAVPLLFLRSAVALLVIAGPCEGPPRRSSGPLDHDSGGAQKQESTCLACLAVRSDSNDYEGAK